MAKRLISWRSALAVLGALGFGGSMIAVSNTARAQAYTRTFVQNRSGTPLTCEGGIKDPMNLYWDSRHTVARVYDIHHGTGSCDGHLSSDSICGTEQVYEFTDCVHSYKKPCTKRDSNKRRYHSRIFRSAYNEVPSHQDQGCSCIKGTSQCLKDGARFNIGRDNQKAKISGSSCQPGERVYWGNTMSIAQGCSVGNQSSDGYVWYVK